MKNNTRIVISLLALSSGCAPETQRIVRVPAVEYAKRIHQNEADTLAKNNASFAGPVAKMANFPANSPEDSMRARVRLVDGSFEDGAPTQLANADLPSQANAQIPGVQSFQSRDSLTRDYHGPLNLGDPGVGASLWKESRGGSDLFRDYRAWQPMDLITITVTESSVGKKKADTDLKQESTIQVALKNFFGAETWSKLNLIGTGDTKGADLSNLINGSATHDFKGEGETKREGSLKAKISAMVAEVLPSGVLRIEGEKIISVNSEDEVMVISGLVRPEDVSSTNEVDSSKVANVRIDYYGQGSVGDLQHGGWLGGFIRRVWPF